MTGDLLLTDWDVRATDIPTRGLAITRQMSAAECADIAVALDLILLSSLVATLKLKPEKGGFRLQGTLKADCQQACIVSLEPVGSVVCENIDVLFSESAGDSSEGGEQSALSAREVEPLSNGFIDVGRIVFETLAAGLDPYPRKDGAEFAWSEPNKGPAVPESPFAALARLQTKQKD